MCGIAGSIEWKQSKGANGFNLDALSNRGPDAQAEVNSSKEGISTADGFRFHLGHARLSIVDLSEEANQPMRTPDGRYWIVFNGEIYNHAELRKELEKSGFRFRTDHSDTEVLLWAFVHWGNAVLNRLNGMFAFVIVDALEGRIFGARDRMGIKPFFYRFSDGIFEFASEIRALKCPKFLNLQAIRQYFHFLQTPGEITFYEDIFKLEAAEAFHWDGQNKINKYVWWNPWQESVHRVKISDEEIEALLIDSVRLRLQADVPVGTYLSGGLDSSLLTAIAAKKQNIKTFSYGFAEGVTGYRSELTHAKRVSNWLNTEHHEVVNTPDEYLHSLNRVFSILDEPISDPACAPLLMLSELAKTNGVSVMLGGEGADELFLGYRHWWDAQRLYTAWHKAPKPLRTAIIPSSRHFLATRKPQWHTWLERMNRGQFPVWGGIDASVLSRETEIFTRDFIEATEHPYKYVHRYMINDLPESSDFFQRLSSFDLRHRLPEQLLARIDRMSMAASVEARVPYLDHRLVEKALHMSLSGIGSHLNQKDVLKRISRKYIPDEIAQRPKDGFTIPLSEVLKSVHNEYDDLQNLGIFNVSRIKKEKEITTYGALAWPLHALQLWLKNNF